MDAIDERIMKQIKDALAEAQENHARVMLATENYWRGREDALRALLEPPKQEPLPKVDEGK